MSLSHFLNYSNTNHKLYILVHIKYIITYFFLHNFQHNIHICSYNFGEVVLSIKYLEFSPQLHLAYYCGAVMA